MKKICLNLMILVMLLALCGCNKKEEEIIEDDSQEEQTYNFEMKDGKLKELYEAGYKVYCDSYDMYTWRGIFNKEDKQFVLVELEMNDDVYAKLDELDFGEDNYWYNRTCVLSEAQEISVEDITSYIPSEEELNNYIGMSIGQLEALGFEDMGYNWGDGEHVLFFSGKKFDCEAEVTNIPAKENIDDITAQERSNMIISKLTCTGLSMRILDNEEDIEE